MSLEGEFFKTKFIYVNNKFACTKCLLIYLDEIIDLSFEASMDSIHDWTLKKLIGTYYKHKQLKISYMKG